VFALADFIRPNMDRQNSRQDAPFGPGRQGKVTLPPPVASGAAL
jgi:hypothetical protein